MKLYRAEWFDGVRWSWMTAIVMATDKADARTKVKATHGCYISDRNGKDSFCVQLLSDVTQIDEISYPQIDEDEDD